MNNILKDENKRLNVPLIEQRADPYVYRHTDGKYYFTASVPAYDKIILRCADSLYALRDAQEKSDEMVRKS